MRTAGHGGVSCVEDLVSSVERAWSNARRAPRSFRPAFPVANVENLGQKLTAMGVKSTPVVFVSDPASGRILFTSSVPPGEKSDPAIAQRIEALAKPCD